MTFMEAVLDGLRLVLVWPAPGYMLLGVAIGMFFGAVPGLGGLVGMAIILPFTFGMEPNVAFAFILGMYAVTTTADTLSSVLLGIPGTAASQATILDGYPMAQRGEASRALGAAYTVSMIGGVVGAVFLAASIPLVRPIILVLLRTRIFRPRRPWPYHGCLSQRQIHFQRNRRRLLRTDACNDRLRRVWWRPTILVWT